jgi:hypothetical protein
MLETGVGLLAKAKKKGEVQKTEPVQFGKKQPVVFTIRGSAEWKAWVERLSDRNRQSVSGLIDTALAKFAREIGFEDPPER